MIQYNHNYLNDGEPEVYMKVTVREGSALDTSWISETFNWCLDGLKQLWEMFYKWV